MKNIRLINNLRILLFGLVLVLTIYRATYVFGLRGVLCDSDWLTIVTRCVWINVTLEIILWIIAVTLLIVLLLLEHNFSKFFGMCKQNWLLFAFVFLAFLSITWSLEAEISLYKALILLFTTLVAIYMGQTYHLHDLINLFVLYYVFIGVLNFLFIILLYPWGVMNSEYANGAWQGIFWNRTYLGCFMVPGVILFIVKILERKRYSNNDLYLSIVMLIITSLLLVMSGCITAILTVIIILGIIVIYSFLLKFYRKVKPIHYYSFLTVFIGALIVIFTNLDTFFNIFGRNSTLTHRVPMWEYVYHHLIIQRPWIGFGYGVIWHLVGIRNGLAVILHWRNPVLIGDNGYVDILLHIGIVGLLVLIALIVFGLIRGIKYTSQNLTLESALPVLILIALIVANIALSLILESESFMWLINVALIVGITPKLPYIIK